MGSPTNISIVDLDLDGPKYFRNLVVGFPDSQNYDGVHCSGEGAKRQFTYQTIKQLKTKVFHSAKLKPTQMYNRYSRTKSTNPHPPPQSYADATRSNTGYSNQSDAYHCQYSVPTQNMYTQAHMRSEQNTRYEVPTQNRFAGLGDNFQGN